MQVYNTSGSTRTSWKALLGRGASGRPCLTCFMNAFAQFINPLLRKSVRLHRCSHHYCSVLFSLYSNRHFNQQFNLSSKCRLWTLDIIMKIYCVITWMWFCQIWCTALWDCAQKVVSMPWTLRMVSYENPCKCCLFGTIANIISMVMSLVSTLK